MHEICQHSSQCRLYDDHNGHAKARPGSEMALLLTLPDRAMIDGLFLIHTPQGTMLPLFWSAQTSKKALGGFWSTQTSKKKGKGLTQIGFATGVHSTYEMSSNLRCHNIQGLAHRPHITIDCLIEHPIEHSIVHHIEQHRSSHYRSLPRWR